MTTTTFPTLPDDLLDTLVEGARSPGRWNSAILGDGWSVTVECDVDEYTNVMTDEDWYGALEWGTRSDADHVGYHGAPIRPKNFDGESEIIQRGGWYDPDLWWQPPKNLRRDDPDAYRSMRQGLLDILQYGYSIVTVTIKLVRDDGYSREWGASLFGIDPNATDDDLRNVIIDTYDHAQDWEA